MKDNACDVAVKNWLLGTIDNMGERYESVTDCVIGLLRTHLINPIRGRENMPLKVVKWNLSELYTKMEIMKIHELESKTEQNKNNTNKNTKIYTGSAMPTSSLETTEYSTIINENIQ
ncbi:hypothetical protein ACFX1T_043199 [Malus domestica]